MKLHEDKTLFRQAVQFTSDQKKILPVPCYKGTADCGRGWIKWKMGDKLLVNILLLD
jgi:hypothetical protein